MLYPASVEEESVPFKTRFPDSFSSATSKKSICFVVPVSARI